MLAKKKEREEWVGEVYPNTSVPKRKRGILLTAWLRYQMGKKTRNLTRGDKTVVAYLYPFSCDGNLIYPNILDTNLQS